MNKNPDGLRGNEQTEAYELKKNWQKNLREQKWVRPFLFPQILANSIAFKTIEGHLELLAPQYRPFRVHHLRT